MPASFLHGVETINVDTAGGTIKTARSSVIALVGIAPTGDANTLINCYSETDDAQFGKPVPGFNIPKTLQIIRKIAGNCPVLVVNVFNAEDHTTLVEGEAQTVVNGKLKLDFAPIGDVTVLSDIDEPVSLEKDTDYTFDAYGNFKVIKSTIADNTVFHFTYNKLNAAAVVDTDIIGDVDEDNETRTGIQLFDNSLTQFGYFGKILLSPNYIAMDTVAAELRSKAILYKAIVLQDAPYGTTVSGAIAGRGLAGEINFNTSDPRVYLLYPFIKTFDEAAGGSTEYPYSAFMAGVMVKNDLENGYWSSPSNKEILIATGVERQITWNISDAGCQANLLNEQGITTVVSGYGTGIRTWGNRGAAWPNNSDPHNFINVQRTDDVITESLEQGSLNDIDKPLTQSLIDIMKQKGNTLINNIIQQGGLLPGSQLKYNASDNSPSELAAGHVVFERVYMVPTPAERITYRNRIDVNLYNQIV